MGTIPDLPFPIKRQVVSVAFPTIGGLGVGFFGCLLSYSKNQKNRYGHHTKKTRCAQAIATMGSFGFSLFSLVPLALGAPINIVNVVRAGALLPANAVFSQVFGLRPLLKDDYIGTLVTISGVVCFIMFVGPPLPERNLEEFIAQVTRPAPLSYSVVLLCLFFGSVGWMSACLRRRNSARRSKLLALAVSIVISCSIAAMDVATKGWAAALRKGPEGLESPFLYVCFLTQAFFFIVSKWGMIYGCGRCDVLLFVPMNIVLNILFSVTAGMVVLGEATQVAGPQAWVGVIASCITVAAGILLLVTGPADSEDLSAETSTDTGQSDSEDVGDVSSSLDGGAPGRESGGARTAATAAPSRGIQALCLSTSQTSALAGLNRLHIRAARARNQWRQQVFGHLRSRFGAEAVARRQPANAELRPAAGWGRSRWS